MRKGEPYNFSRAGQISNEQMQAISTVNDLFARNLTHNLGAWLRTQFDVTLVSAEQMMYSEFTETIPEPAYVCSARLEPLDVMGVVQTGPDHGAADRRSAAGRRGSGRSRCASRRISKTRSFFRYSNTERNQGMQGQRGGGLLDRGT